MRKVLSLTKQKDKIYKTKNDIIKKNHSAIILHIDNNLNYILPFIKQLKSRDYVMWKFGIVRLLFV